MAGVGSAIRKTSKSIHLIVRRVTAKGTGQVLLFREQPQTSRQRTVSSPSRAHIKGKVNLFMIDGIPAQAPGCACCRAQTFCAQNLLLNLRASSDSKPRRHRWPFSTRHLRFVGFQAQRSLTSYKLGPWQFEGFLVEPEICRILPFMHASAKQRRKAETCRIQHLRQSHILNVSIAKHVLNMLTLARPEKAMTIRTAAAVRKEDDTRVVLTAIPRSSRTTPIARQSNHEIPGVTSRHDSSWSPARRGASALRDVRATAREHRSGAGACRSKNESNSYNCYHHYYITLPLP